VTRVLRGYVPVMEAWVGTSGWTYGHWRDRVYPHGLPQREWLPWYTTRFPTVELNASFYRLPTSAMVQRWRSVTPPGFLFAVKLSRYVTHIRRLRDVDEELGRFLEIVRGLGDRFGPLLVQLPPSFARDDDALDGFLRLVPPDVHVALEFRHPSWEQASVVDRVRAAGAAWVLADRPHARVASTVTSDWSYVRFHQGAEGSPWYPRAKLARWADRIAGLDVRTVYVYFNNDPEGAAVENALTFGPLLADRGIDVRPAAGDVSVPAAVGTTPSV
jgi:uncharacterized protein YecE (DUF72 family)